MSGDEHTDPRPVRTALISVSDKSGIEPFAKALAARGVRIISTGGTARALAAAGIDVLPIDELTGFPEILDGRVKTLHPRVHAGLLARPTPEHEQQLATHEINRIDLVCINLYPFEETIRKPDVTRRDAIENIDIGGPSMIRSAAKNHEAVVVLTDPADYPRVIGQLESGGTTTELRAELAAKAFARTASYDAMITGYLSGSSSPARTAIVATHASSLRYGENPHQTADAYLTDQEGAAKAILQAEQLHGKELSYNNINDATAALELALALATDTDSGAAIVKHANPCGASRAPTTANAIEAALDGDPLAAFGGIIASSAEIDDPSARHLCREGAFLEAVIAPSFSDGAISLLRERWKNVRLLAIGSEPVPAPSVRWRTLAGAALRQSEDALSDGPASWTHASGPPAGDEALQIAWALEPIARALASNAVCIGRRHANGAPMLAGAGAGQMDRVASCTIAAEKAGPGATGAVAFSDAFFPFSDGPQILIDAGVKTIVHPGGSKRDEETFALCAQHAVSCLTTGVRHFRH